MLQSVVESLQDAPPWVSVLVFAAGVGLLLLGGSGFVNGSVQLARKLGVSTLLIGLTVVAFGTSSPELAFNLTAAFDGHPDLAFGNVVGSNIANVGLVLGVSALAAPLVVHSRLIYRELPLLMLVSAVMVVLAVAPPHVRQGDGWRPGFGPVDGTVLVLGFAAFTWLWWRLSRRDQTDPFAAEAVLETGTDPAASVAIGISVGAAGLVALIIGGKLTEWGAQGIATWANLSQSIVGLTVVAIATSLPELVTCVIACRRGHTDLAVGNVIGSNLFNILLVLGATSLMAGVPVPAEPGWFGLDRGWWDLGVMLILTLMLLPICTTNRHRIVRGEGVLLIVCYVAYMTMSVLRGQG